MRYQYIDKASAHTAVLTYNCSLACVDLVVWLSPDSNNHLIVWLTLASEAQGLLHKSLTNSIKIGEALKMHIINNS